MKHKFFQPAIPREVYTMRAVEREWPSGEWVELEAEGTPSAPEGDLVGLPCPPSAPTLTIIGGTKYDEDALRAHLKTLPRWSRVIVGDGRGAERFVGIVAVDEIKIVAEEIAPDPDRFGKLARKVNVEQVLCTSPDSPVLLVGKGERVKQAKSVLQRAKWTREVVELP